MTVAFSKASQTLYLKFGETEICVTRDKVTDDDITVEFTHRAIGIVHVKSGCRHKKINEWSLIKINR